MTPEGEELAGWWRRVFALLIDTAILAVASLAVSYPFLKDKFEAAFAPASGVEVSASDSALVGLIGIALGFCYFVGFWTTIAATPGKLMLGLRVRFGGDPDRRFEAAVKRWLVHWLVAAMATFVSTLEPVFEGFWYLNMLWPLWDHERQALHDKFAATHVVLVR